jgi:hypothetical protein
VSQDRFETETHGSPWRVVTFTPPVVADDRAPLQAVEGALEMLAEVGHEGRGIEGLSDGGVVDVPVLEVLGQVRLGVESLHRWFHSASELADQLDLHGVERWPAVI